MKRILVLILAIVLLLSALHIAGCTGKDEGPAEGAIEENGIDDMQIPNPAVEHERLEDMITTTGVPMTVPDGVSILSVRSIDNTYNEIEILVDSVVYILRKAESTSSDISGVYENWEHTKSMLAPHSGVGEVQVSYTDDKGIVTWNDGTYAHSIYAERDFDIDTALSLALP